MSEIIDANLDRHQPERQRSSIRFLIVPHLVEEQVHEASPALFQCRSGSCYRGGFFLAKVVVGDAQEHETVVDRFRPYAPPTRPS